VIRLWAGPAESKYLKHACGIPTLYSASIGKCGGPFPRGRVAET